MVSSCIGLVLKAQTLMAAFFEQKKPVLTRQPLRLGDTTRTIVHLVVVRDKLCIIPCLSKVCLPTARSRGSIRTSIGTIPSLPWLSCSDPTKLCSSTSILLMWSRTRMTRSNNLSWLLHDRWDHCHAQHYDWFYILDIYEGFEVWKFLEPIPSYHGFHQCPRYSRNPRI